MCKKIATLLLVTSILFSCKEEKKVEPMQQEEIEVQTDSLTSLKVETIDIENQIQTIKNNFKATESSLSTLQIKNKKYEDDQNITKELVGYYKKTNCIKLIQTTTLGHGLEKYSYYLKNDSLYFVFKEVFEEASVNGPFTKKETRYYINDDVIIQILNKENTFKKINEDNMSNIENKDITLAVNIIKELDVLKNDFSKSLEKLKSKNIVIEEGTWISDDDKSTGIMIHNGKWIFYANRTETADDVFDFKIINKSKDPQVIVFKGNETYEYILIENTSNKLKLIYTPRGNTLSFTKRKN